MLLRLGASTLHGVDATKMRFHPDLNMQKFDRIIFNFPHDDNRLIEIHKKLVLGFFKNARGMLRPYGEIHVSHKTSHPFNHWNINELAFKNSLLLVECVDFKIEDYPGYNNKRGHKKRCDEPFPLGECSTFKFRFVPAIKASEAPLHLDNTRTRSELSNGHFDYGPFEQAVTCLLQNMNVVLPEPLVYRFCMDLIRISEVYQTPVGSILQYLFYWAFLFGYQRSIAEACGGLQQYQANSIVHHYHQHPSAPSDLLCNKERNGANGDVAFGFP